MRSARQRLAARRAQAARRPPVDLADLILSDVIDQGPRPTCVPCGIAIAHEVERNGTAYAAAIEPLWWSLHATGDASEHGTTVTAAGAALSSTGQCHAHEWPYNSLIGHGTESPPVGVSPPPWTTAELSDLPVAHDGIEDAIEDELALGHPVLIVIEATDAFFNPAAADGHVETPPIDVDSAGYHAVLAVGAWTDPVHGRVLLIRNSWGERWGLGGYCTLDTSYLVAFAVQAAKVMVPA